MENNICLQNSYQSEIRWRKTFLPAKLDPCKHNLLKLYFISRTLLWNFGHNPEYDKDFSRTTWLLVPCGWGLWSLVRHSASCVGWCQAFGINTGGMTWLKHDPLLWPSSHPLPGRVGTTRSERWCGPPSSWMQSPLCELSPVWDTYDISILDSTNISNGTPCQII